MFYFSVREIFLYLIILLCHNDTLFEYSGWFYISCPVIRKSLFKSSFVHTES